MKELMNEVEFKTAIERAVRTMDTQGQFNEADLGKISDKCLWSCEREFPSLAEGIACIMSYVEIPTAVARIILGLVDMHTQFHKAEPEPLVAYVLKCMTAIEQTAPEMPLHLRWRTAVDASRAMEAAGFDLAQADVLVMRQPDFDALEAQKGKLH